MERGDISLLFSKKKFQDISPRHISEFIRDLFEMKSTEYIRFYDDLFGENLGNGVFGVNILRYKMQIGENSGMSNNFFFFLKKNKKMIYRHAIYRNLMMIYLGKTRNISDLYENDLFCEHTTIKMWY